MKWMPKITKEIEKAEVEELQKMDPVSLKDIEQAIELINVAKKINAHFKITLYLTIGEFGVDSDSFNGIKILKKTKSEKDRIVINHYNALFSTETTIDIDNIFGFTVDVGYMNEWTDEKDDEKVWKMYEPEDRYWEVLTYLEFEKRIKMYRKRIKELEDENQKLKDELKNVRQ